MGKVIHGMSHTKIHQVWLEMLNRCMNSNCSYYHNYGGRGISVCDRWMDFTKFYSDMGDKEEGMTLDRIDNDGDYCPENCRWATRHEQARNTRRTRIINHNGLKMCIKDWSYLLGMSSKTLKWRLDNWSVHKAMTHPVRKKTFCTVEDN